MPRRIDPLAYTNWVSTPILHGLLVAIQAHFDDASTGDRKNKQVIPVALEELTEECLRALADLGLDSDDLIRIAGGIYMQQSEQYTHAQSPELMPTA